MWIYTQVYRKMHNPDSGNCLIESFSQCKLIAYDFRGHKILLFPLLFLQNVL